MKKIFLLIFTLSFLIVGCHSQNGKREYPTDYPDSPSYTTDDILYPENTGKKVLQSQIATIDYSHTELGYIMAYLNQAGSQKIKLQIKKDDKIYYYDLLDQVAVSFPLQMGNGQYSFAILKHTQGDKYAVIKSIKLDVTMTNELSPYLYPNQLVQYQKDDYITQLAIDTVQQDQNDLARIKDIYNYVVDTISYDDSKAVTATQKYIIPNLKELIQIKKGICFDYASLMTAMLRINHIPARLICGDTDIEYHAWVEVYLEGAGWVNPDIFVDKEKWSRMDPTFASSKFDYDGNYEAIYYY